MQILFVCTGNTCRSPLAEAIARNAILERGLTGIEVSSAGTDAWDGGAASEGSLLAGLEKGLNVSEHRSRLLTPQLVEAADLILVMGSRHLERARELGGEGKTHLLAAFGAGSQGYGASYDISDPFGGGLDDYRRTFDELSAAVGAALDRLERERKDR